jgi:hypothetical protein
MPVARRPYSRRVPTISGSAVERVGTGALLVLPAGLIVYLSFNAGGFFVAAPAIAAVVIALVLLLRTTLARSPFAGIGRAAALGGLLLALFATWTLASGFWSGAPARALLEFDRALLYLFVFLLFAALGRTHGHVSWLIRSVALGILVVCTIALITRVAPDVWPISADIHSDRLAYPLTYWNALGLLGVFGAILCFHLSASASEPLVGRLVAAGAFPAMAATVLLTFSRGAIAVGAVALVVYVVLGRPRVLLGAAVACLPAAAVAVVLAYRSDIVASEHFATSAGIAQGHRLALAIALCCLGAIALRLLLTPADNRLAKLRLPSSARGPVLAGAILVPLLAVVFAFAAFGAAGYLKRQYQGFIHGASLSDNGDVRGRLTRVSNNGRIQHWKVALDYGYKSDRLKGSGAGTYQLLWARHRPGEFTVNDGHSLYVEVLGELGLVGFFLIVAAVLTLLIGLGASLLPRAAAGAPDLYAALFAVTLAWAVHAGVDWDWEMPAVTAPVLVLAGAGLAAERKRLAALQPTRFARVAIAIGLLVMVVTPFLAARSQGQLDRSVSALKRGDCRTSINAALASIAALSLRPEPWEVLGFCDSALGAHQLAVRALDNSVTRDPRSWETHYGLALVRAKAGLDPRREARRALARNPHDPQVVEAVKAFRRRSRAAWRRSADRLGLPLH